MTPTSSPLTPDARGAHAAGSQPQAGGETPSSHSSSSPGDGLPPLSRPPEGARRSERALADAPAGADSARTSPAGAGTDRTRAEGAKDRGSSPWFGSRPPSPTGGTAAAASPLLDLIEDLVNELAEEERVLELNLRAVQAGAARQLKLRAQIRELDRLRKLERSLLDESMPRGFGRVGGLERFDVEAAELARAERLDLEDARCEQLAGGRS